MKLQSGLEVHVRLIARADENFVKSNWRSEALKYLASGATKRARIAIGKVLSAQIAGYLTGWPCWVACEPSDHNHLFGFACGGRGEWADRERPSGPPVLHYVYVKPPYRRNGIGAALVAAACGPGRPLVATFRDERPLLDNVCYVGSGPLVA